MPPSRTTLFPKPYPEVSAGWDELTTAQQKIWHAWALGNKVQDTDFRNIIRSIPNAFSIIAPNAVAERFDPIDTTYPPPAPEFHPGTLVLNSTQVTTTPSANLYVANQTTTITRWALWVSPYYTLGNEPALSALVWIDTVPIPPGSGPGIVSPDFLAGLTDKIGNPADHEGDLFVLFAWEASNGQLRYEGASRIDVTP